jgi:hypothetical protein
MNVSHEARFESALYKRKKESVNSIVQSATISCRCKNIGQSYFPGRYGNLAIQIQLSRRFICGENVQVARFGVSQHSSRATKRSIGTQVLHVTVASNKASA